jgi:hypothetical protein
MSQKITLANKPTKHQFQRSLIALVDREKIKEEIAEHRRNRAEEVRLGYCPLPRVSDSHDDDTDVFSSPPRVG